MPLAAFTVEKYRSFVRPTRIELRPLTLLFGYNSAGKSSLLRTLPLLAASVEPASPGPLALGSEAARGATFADIKSHLDKGSFLLFSLEWDDDSSPLRRVEIRLFDVENLREQVVERIRIFDAHEELMLEAEWDPVEGEAGTRPSTRYLARLGEGEAMPVRLEFAGLIPRIRETLGLPSERHERLREVFQALSLRLDSLRSSVHWLGSLRALPPRRADYLGRPKSMHPSGKEAAAILAYDKRGQGEMLRRVSAWFEGATRHSLDVIEESGRFSLAFSPLHGAPVRINLVDTGEGMAQVLPVLVLGVQALQGELGGEAVLAIEHPELHLHPAAERDLAGFFCELARQDGAPRTLMETHSENFLLRVQLAIARGELPPERVMVYWVQELEDGSGQADPITFDPLGRPVGDRWPPGVFSEDVEQARQLVLERRKAERRQEQP